eukprot:8273710-Pyramimonas_sp.AAC.1
MVFDEGSIRGGLAHRGKHRPPNPPSSPIGATQVRSVSLSRTCRRSVGDVSLSPSQCQPP